MGVFILVGKKEFLLSNAEMYNRFLDYLAEEDICPVLMGYMPGDTEVDLKGLADDVQFLLDKEDVPEFILFIADTFSRAIKTVLTSRLFDTLS